MSKKEIGYSSVLVVKINGQKSEVLKFLFKLKDIYDKDRLSMSPILKNTGDDGYHCFVDIVPDPNEPVQKIQVE